MAHVESTSANTASSGPPITNSPAIAEALGREGSLSDISSYLNFNPSARTDIEAALVDAGRFTEFYVVAQAQGPGAVDRARVPQGEGGVTDIYIGGGGDGKTEIVHDYEDNLRAQEGRTTAYFQHNQLDAAIAFANERIADGDTINIIGHSWGSDTAVQLARAIDGEGGKVELLVGIDPVSKPGPDWFGGTDRPDNVDTVVTVQADGRNLGRNQIIEGFGELVGGGVPNAFNDADVNIEVDADHADFNGIYGAEGEDGLSARELVDQVYAESLSDE